MRFCFAAKFTEFPRNVTATEGQNVEMSCAFQSGSASVYLEIQWWFLRGPEGPEPPAEVAGAQVEDWVALTPAASVPVTPWVLRVSGPGVQDLCLGVPWEPPALLAGVRPGDASGQASLGPGDSSWRPRRKSCASVWFRLGMASSWQYWVLSRCV